MLLHAFLRWPIFNSSLETISRPLSSKQRALSFRRRSSDMTLQQLRTATLTLVCTTTLVNITLKDSNISRNLSISSRLFVEKTIQTSAQSILILVWCIRIFRITTQQLIASWTVYIETLLYTVNHTSKLLHAIKLSHMHTTWCKISD